MCKNLIYLVYTYIKIVYINVYTYNIILFGHTMYNDSK